MNNPKISVCIPFYNIEPYISRCLDSVLGNTYKNLEVICVNDGSTDGTAEVLHEYAKKDSRVVVVDKKNGGLVSARKAVLDIATGDFLSFVDGDDWVHPQFFEILLTAQEKTKADVVICNYKWCYEFTKPLEIEADSIFYQASDSAVILRDWNSRIHIDGRIFSRELLPKIDLPNYINMGEDTAFNLLFLFSKRDTRVALVEEAMYCYYQRESSIVHTVSHACKIDVSLFLIEHYSEIKNNDRYGIVLHEVIRVMLSYRYLMLFSGDRKTVHRTCKSIYDFCKENWNGSFSMKDKMKYTVLYYCPFIYRLFRIVTDPTMLDWECAEKKLQREKAGQ